jgi:hypothetical protein
MTNVLLKDITLYDTLRLSKKKLIGKIESITNHHSPTAWLLTPPGTDYHRPTLVAHVDTVFDRKRISPLVCRDKELGVYWSPDGLGADDRAGVYGIIRAFNSLPVERRPNLLFCDEEETGAQGAQDACEVFESILEHSLFFVELDRRGTANAVFYNGEPQDFKAFICSHGFTEAHGTFSDVLYLGEYFRVCSANLSTGYYEEHTRTEHLWERDLNLTITKTIDIVTSGLRLGKRWEHRVTSSPKSMFHQDWHGFGRTYYDSETGGAVKFQYNPDDYEFADSPEPVDAYIQRNMPGYRPNLEPEQDRENKLSRKERRKLKKQMERQRDPFYFEPGGERR